MVIFPLTAPSPERYGASATQPSPLPSPERFAQAGTGGEGDQGEGSFGRMDHDQISKIIGLTRYANAMEKLSQGLREDLCLLEKEIRKMIERRWTHIMLHHSASEDGRTFDWQGMRRYQMSWRIDGVSVAREEFGRRSVAKQGKLFQPPWSDISYHFGNEKINDRYEILVGRDLDQDGAHCVGMNHQAIGICFVGNFDEAPVPPEQWKKGIELVRSLLKVLDIPIRYVVGHRDYAPKTCPGKLFSLEQFRKDLMASWTA